jgi:phage anti-repressor protein
METKLEDFIVKRSNIPKEFLNDFFNLGGNSYGDTYKNINFDNIVKWLDVQKNHLKRLLKDNFKVMDDYTEEKILVKNKKRGANYVSKIMLTPDCFKELCMLSQSDKAKGVRKYYIVAEGLLRDHFEQIINELNKELGLIKTNIKKPIEVIGGHIYILKAMNTSQKNMFKLGNSDDMKKRLRVYNTGNANNIEPLFVMKVDDINMVEGCVKNLAREYQYKKNKEVYNIDFEFLKKLCIKCKNFIKQLEKEFSNDMKTTKSKLKIIKNNSTKDNKNITSFYMIIDKK